MAFNLPRIVSAAFDKVIMGHWVTTPTFVRKATENEFAAYNLPQGVISHLYRAAAGRKPVVVSRVGLKAFADPRNGGGKLNQKAREDLVELVTIDGKEYLQYKTPRIDICFVRGTTADPMGNVTAEKEAAFIDALPLVMATRASGGMLDLVCVGAAQVDPHGNVNVGKIGSRIFGVGGFSNLTLAAKKVAFLTTFTDSKGLSVDYKNGGLDIAGEGKIKKFVRDIEQISFSGEVAVEDQREILYVTERCVFRLTSEGLLLTEIAPGVDLEKDIFAQMEFRPKVSDELKIMDEDYFRF